MMVARRTDAMPLERRTETRFGTCLQSKGAKVIMSKAMSDFTNVLTNLVYFGIPVIIMSGFVTAISPLGA
tara:strand:- start:364 stop:573 length:210 start_codon:yes stop_codon:yes gene_type:complete